VHLTEGLFLYHEGENKSGAYGQLRIPQKYVEIDISHHPLSGHTNSKMIKTRMAHKELEQRETSTLEIYVEIRITENTSVRLDTVTENTEILICYKFL